MYGRIRGASGTHSGFTRVSCLKIAPCLPQIPPLVSQGSKCPTKPHRRPDNRLRPRGWYSPTCPAIGASERVLTIMVQAYRSQASDRFRLLASHEKTPHMAGLVRGRCRVIFSHPVWLAHPVPESRVRARATRPASPPRQSRMPPPLPSVRESRRWVCDSAAPSFHPHSYP